MLYEEVECSAGYGSTEVQYNLQENTANERLWSYGSKTCFYEGSYRNVSICKTKSAKLLSQLNVTLVEFDPVTVHAPVNSGFVSLVEASSLFNGRALITVGRGAYQKYLVQHFLKQHQDSNSPNAAKKLHYHLPCERSTSQQAVNELVFPDNVCA